MADDVVLPGTGDTVAADEIAGKKYQRIKPTFGPAGTAADALGGAGPVAPGVQRQTLADDDPAVVALAAILAKLIASPATEAKQDDAIVLLSAISTALGTLQGYVDGLEGLVDGLETLLGTTNSALTTIDGRVDGLEALITTLNGYTDGIEALIGTTNSTLSTLAGYVDQLEGFVDGIEGKLDTLHTDLAAAQPRIASMETGSIYSGATALTPKFAKVAISASGEIVAAVSSKKIRVLSLKLIANGTVNVKWQGDSGGTPVDLTGLSYFVANAGEVLPFSPVGHFETAAGKNLYLNLSASIAVGGHITYVEV